MTVSGYSDVDSNDPVRLVGSLARRATVQLYEPYREALLAQVAGTSGLVVDVGAGGGHLLRRISTVMPGRAAIGVEPSTAMASVACAAGNRVVLGSGSNLPLRDGVAGCVVAERVLQHVPDVRSVLVDAERVLGGTGKILAVDPAHAEVRLAAPAIQDLADRLVAWRARCGLASPDAASVAGNWLTRSGFTVAQATYWCETSEYVPARSITNFPEWAQLAQDAGEDISNLAVRTWEQHWTRVATTGEADVSPWFHWPMVLTAAMR